MIVLSWTVSFNIIFSTFIRRLMILEEQYKEACLDLESKQKNLKEVRPSTAKVKKDGAKVKVLENQLDKHLV